MEKLRLQNVLCIRADNMGDLLMSTPAFRAIKETFGCKITVLTSAMGSLITSYIKEINETIIANVPWVKTDKPADEILFAQLVQTLSSRAFDAAIIFTVYSQSSLPAAMLAFLSGIPVRAAYCRENPYTLLTHWIPDEEPFTFIQHQVERDLRLVASLHASPASLHLSINYSEKARETAFKKLQDISITAGQLFVIFHPGVSEEKRKYLVPLWIEAGKQFLQQYSIPIIITGSKSETALAAEIQSGIGFNCFSTAGLFTIEELIAVIDSSQLLLSVNTGTVHIAAALQKPVVVLYALTNPQHTPWQTPHRLLYFSVEETLKSKNQIISYVSKNIMDKNVAYPKSNDVLKAINDLLLIQQVH